MLHHWQNNRFWSKFLNNYGIISNNHFVLIFRATPSIILNNHFELSFWFNLFFVLKHQKSFWVWNHFTVRSLYRHWPFKDSQIFKNSYKIQFWWYQKIIPFFSRDLVPKNLRKIRKKFSKFFKVSKEIFFVFLVSTNN